MWRRPIISLGGLALFFLCASAVAASGQSVRGGEATEGADPVFANPIVAGFAPDPSIVRVGDDFYMVNSTFEYFPALPIRHSRDLVNWRLIGYAVTDPEPLALDRVPSSGGMQAPTIRHHDGLFYVVATIIVGDRPMSFVTTAREPQGPWSSPHVIEEAEGIDPALFFDDDGTAWYTANRIPPDPEFEAQAEIWLQRLDLQTFDLVGERYALWRGCCQGICGDWALAVPMLVPSGVFGGRRVGHWFLSAATKLALAMGTHPRLGQGAGARCEFQDMPSHLLRAIVEDAEQPALSS